MIEVPKLSVSPSCMQFKNIFCDARYANDRLL